MKRIQIRMKMTKDTRKTCERLRQMWQPYFEGRTRPHFPVPAIPNHLDYIAAEPLSVREDFEAIGWWGIWGLRRVR